MLGTITLRVMPGTLIFDSDNTLVFDCFTSVRIVLRCFTVYATDVPTVSQLPESLSQHNDCTPPDTYRAIQNAKSNCCH